MVPLDQGDHLMRFMTWACVAVLTVVGLFSVPGLAQSPLGEGEMRAVIETYVADRGSLSRSYPVSSATARRDRFRKFYADALADLGQLNFDAMSQDGKA